MDKSAIAARIHEQECLLLLEERHLLEVVLHALDETTARWVITIRKREISKLKTMLERLQRDDAFLKPVPPPRRRLGRRRSAQRL